MLGRLFRSFFFGNYFYGCCVVALSLESSIQQGIVTNSIFYYFSVFCSTVVYYTYAYQGQDLPIIMNERVLWYRIHSKQIRTSQLFLSCLLLISTFLFFTKLTIHWLDISFITWISIFIFPIVAILYYGSELTSGKHFNIRKYGWLKPFVIGFVWSGIVTVYPSIAATIEQNSIFYFTLLKGLLFTKNFLFISALCIMFDIKDYADDYNKQLKTFVVRVGLRNTIFYVLSPISILGLTMFLTYSMILNFTLWRILLNTIPFALLLLVAYSMYQRKSILYYLTVIDGLMLVKALCGILGMII